MPVEKVRGSNMHIKDIAISSMRRSDDGGMILGDVVFLIAGDNGIEDQNLKLTCTTSFSERLRPDAALIGAAISRLRKLPGVRSGAERLTFEQGMRPLASKAPMDSKVVNG